jgi:hypothetical protein
MKKVEGRLREGLRHRRPHDDAADVRARQRRLVQRLRRARRDAGRRHHLGVLQLGAGLGADLDLGPREKKNRGEAKIIDLLEAKTKQAEIGLQEFFNKRMLQGAGGSTITTAYTSAMNGSSFVDPLPLQVKYDPTASTIGNINQNTNTWWRNQTRTSRTHHVHRVPQEAAQPAQQLQRRARAGRPICISPTQGTEELYEAALAAAHRNPSYQVADIPFDNVAFYGKPVTWDEFVPDFGDGTVTQTKGSWSC